LARCREGRKKAKFAFALAGYWTIMQTEIVFASHTQLRSLLVAVLFMEEISLF
jgi:hypothetical protein